MQPLINLIIVCLSLLILIYPPTHSSNSILPSHTPHPSSSNPIILTFTFSPFIFSLLTRSPLLLSLLTPHSFTPPPLTPHSFTPSSFSRPSRPLSLNFLHIQPPPFYAPPAPRTRSFILYSIPSTFLYHSPPPPITS